MRVVIDDRLLRSVLLDSEPTGLRRLRRNDELWTTGTWLYRLCQAVAAPEVQGALSGPLAKLPAPLREAVTAKLVTPPGEVGLLSLRELAWEMGLLVHRRPLNFIALEALAAALAVDAAICVGEGNRSPRLEAAAHAEGVRYRVVSSSN